MAEVKKRKIGKKDWDKCAEFVKNEHEARKRQKFRSAHETIWREVDRQIYMEPMKRYRKDGSEIDPEWRSVMELGELAKASEIITADVMRLTFPTNRSWFEVHSELPIAIDPVSGKNTPDAKMQDMADRAYRACLVEQHMDFGLKGRYELSVKEALHHGSYVAEIRWEPRTRVYDGSSINQTAAPVWVPYSMWNSYPDPSPSVIGTDLFYTGSMILVDFVPRHILKEMMRGEGWMLENFDKIPKKNNVNKDVDTQDLELVKYYGDLVIDRQDGDIYLPNAKFILANGIPIYYAPNELPYPSIIYSGYERMDVRDPYYTSPLIKLAPMQKLGSQLANKLIDSMVMKIEPPVAYDANDPQLVLDGGPRMHPGAKIGVKGSYGVKEISLGDPQSAMVGLEFVIGQLNQGLGINAIRAGAGDDPSDKTATEITTADVKAEIRTGEFVDKQERHALRPFLYMQHELNKKHMQRYTFYNPEIDAPDFMTIKGSDIPKNTVFDVVGSRGAIGEKARASGVFNVTAALLGNPRTAQIPNVVEIAKMAYQDAGVKNPERIMNTEEPEIPPEMQQKMQEMDQAMQSMQEENYKLKENLAITKAVNDAKLAETITRSQVTSDNKKYTVLLQGELEKLKAAISVAEAGTGNVSVQEIHSMYNKLNGLLEGNYGETFDYEDIIKDIYERLDEPVNLQVVRGKDGKMTSVVGGRKPRDSSKPRPVTPSEKANIKKELSLIAETISELKNAHSSMKEKLEQGKPTEPTEKKAETIIINVDAKPGRVNKKIRKTESGYEVTEE